MAERTPQGPPENAGTILLWTGVWLLTVAGSWAAYGWPAAALVVVGTVTGLAVAVACGMQPASEPDPRDVIVSADPATGISVMFERLPDGSVRILGASQVGDGPGLEP